MLAKLLKTALDEREISVREAAQEMGVSHTTVHRVLNGENPAHVTLLKITNWLGTPAEAFAVVERSSVDGIAGQLLVFIEKNPKLREEFTKVLKAYREGEINEHDVEDIINYVNYRLAK